MSAAPVSADASVPPGGSEAAPAATDTVGGPETDALLQALIWLTRHHGRERSAVSLLAGMPVDGALRPAQALRVMQEAGFHASLLPRRLEDLSPLMLPVVALLREGDACLITRLVDGQAADPVWELVLPAAGGAVCQVRQSELAAEYLGHLLAVAPRLRPEPGSEAALLQTGRHWLWGTLRRFLPYYRSALMAALISNVMMLVTGLVTSVVFDKVIPHQAFVTLWTLALGAGLALGLDLAARQLRSHLIDLSGRKADLIIGSLLFRQTLGVRMEHRPASSGAFAHHLAQIETVRDFFASATLSTLSDLPFIALFVGMCFIVGGPLGWVLAGSIPLILLMVAVIQGQLRRSTRASLAHQTDLQGVLVEAVEGLEDLKSCGAQGRFLQRYENATAHAALAAMRSRSISAWSNNLAAAAQQAVTLVMLVWGVYLIRDGVITAGALIGAVMFAGRAIAPLGSVVSLAVRYQGAMAAMQSLDRLMQLPTEREQQRAYLPRPQLQGGLALRQASFAYPPTGTDRPPVVLKDLNLAIQPGDRVAILGRIGSGKSTILRLLAGLYQPTEGRVEADGIDLRQIDPADFRAAVGFVTQEPRLFAGTLRDNVLMGRSAADPAALQAVAQLTGLDRLVAGHPLGWDLPVGERGGLLSGGQRQLVALARSLVVQPRLLLMDEPTSSMDAQSEALFLQRLQAAVGTRTLVVVTHRPAVLDLVTRILVVDNGRLVMDGPKAAVLAALAGAPAPAGTGTPAPAGPPTAPQRQAGA
ncbi:type I secretion system permease/ATPase [Ideonella livida]|uniref:Cyclolysin secretion/processing ATP-binding protein CyaB n=1 Tax=Ideonella livida TaxID=2707176 RepID=A0A7C9TM53_9BURK|nr:type I secretion system permease/ATPase [Ideonella livida]NDY94020.1 type I secretion system permease/ATPase [Ideonella livida]